MKDRSFLIPVRNFSLFAYLVLLGSVSYVAFPSYFADHTWANYVNSAGFSFIFYAVLYFFVLRHTMKMRWILLLVTAIALSMPFLEYFQLQHELFHIISFTIYMIFLAAQIFKPRKEEETV